MFTCKLCTVFGGTGYKMKIILLSFFSCYLMASCSAAPTSNTTNSTLVITDNFFKKNFVIYTGQHDIVNIFVPFNRYNIQEDATLTSDTGDELRLVFFAEADVNNGKKTDQGFYVYKDRKATKLIDNGRDAAATNENTVYIGASNGIYKYNETTNSAAKHGTVTDDIIQMAHNNVTNDVYYLTTNHELFKLDADATASVKVSTIKDVQALVFGFDGNMYYYDSEKNVYVTNDKKDAVPKKFEGLPSNIDKMTLVSPLNGIEQGAVLIVDKIVYLLKPDATVVKSVVKLQVEITALAPQPTIIQYFAKDKQLYKFNIFVIVFSNVLNELKNVISENVNALRGYTLV